MRTCLGCPAPHLFASQGTWNHLCPKARAAAERNGHDMTVRTSRAVPRGQPAEPDDDLAALFEITGD